VGYLTVGYLTVGYLTVDVLFESGLMPATTAKPHIAVIGCGIVGAAIAYELSQLSNLQITVFDKQQPAQASTGAALGVLMGAISHKTKGRAWRLRETSLKRYETLIPELSDQTQQQILYNRQGIVMLLSEGTDLANWDALITKRQQQGWVLECWSRDSLRDRCPQVEDDTLVAAMYSPGDRQLDPTALTLALVEAAQQRGVAFQFETPVTKLELTTDGAHTVHTSRDRLTVDGVVLAAGLGASPLTQAIAQPLDVRPVLGQAMQVRLPKPMGFPDFQPVLTGSDIHIVPLGNAEYWIGATVEFPDEAGNVEAQEQLLKEVLQGAIAFCPALANSDIVKTWSGKRPRPFNRPAPILEPLPDHSTVWLATGHYRNGVLLAPATALTVADWVQQRFG
jgi:glycine/D-amino acid oxidase-like deaminating enzyme